MGIEEFHRFAPALQRHAQLGPEQGHLEVQGVVAQPAVQVASGFQLLECAQLLFLAGRAKHLVQHQQRGLQQRAVVQQGRDHGRVAIGHAVLVHLGVEGGHERIVQPRVARCIGPHQHGAGQRAMVIGVGAAQGQQQGVVHVVVAAQIEVAVRDPRRAQPLQALVARQRRLRAGTGELVACTPRHGVEMVDQAVHVMHPALQQRLAVAAILGLQALQRQARLVEQALACQRSHPLGLQALARVGAAFPRNGTVQALDQTGSHGWPNSFMVCLNWFSRIPSPACSADSA